MASIMKRGDSYSVRYKYKDHSGKPCEGWESFKTRKEAQERKITVEKELLDGTFLVPDTMTVEEMLYKWIPIQSTKHKWSPKTYTQSVAMVQNLIVPYIGKRKVQELRTYDIEKFYATLAKTPCGQYVHGVKQDLSKKQKKRLLSSTSIHEVHTLLKTAFSYAVDGRAIILYIHYIALQRRALFMILTVNIGNTHITVGGYEQDTLRFCGRLHSDTAATVDEYAIRLVNLLSLHGASPAQIEGGILGSVVPVLSGRVLSALRILCNARILTVGPGLKSGIKLRLDNPAQLGAELLCGAVAALAECSGPLVVISADTAISMMAVNAKQELVGGVILPGPQLSLSALVKNTAQLPQIDLAAKAPASILGKSTSSCLQNGFVLGTASLLDGLAERFCAELGPQTAFYATGNLPIPIREACCTPILYRETLITDGLYRIWMKNKKG